MIEEFKRSDSLPMVAAALYILGSLAQDPEKRHRIATPWAWELRQKARGLRNGGYGPAARQASVVARMVSAVALGEISSDELFRAGSDIDVSTSAFNTALQVLESVMNQGLDVA
ncbi:hypothetical protein AKJ09_11160 [Labilithrix luteola]|uniref:Uncharacterized protein n=1 Tax=Labilithrix luteola TaxID=1391654 RepID=A0A0K1QFR1_9BACT|nr:hypothetical protein AKJ09_11160 [Labilithrix luteola]